MNALQGLLLALVTLSAFGVVLNRDPMCQVIAVSYYGILLGVLFFAFKAPDVALSQITIGAVVLPLMALLSLGRVKAEEQRREDEKSRRKEAA